VSGCVELSGGCQPGRSTTNNSHFLSGTNRRWAGFHPALLEGVVYDGVLNIFYSYWVIVYTEDTRTL